MFRAWELSPGAYNTLPIRGPTTIRTVFMVADDNLVISIRQPAKCKSNHVIALKTIYRLNAKVFSIPCMQNSHLASVIRRAI